MIDNRSKRSIRPVFKTEGIDLERNKQKINYLFPSDSTSFPSILLVDANFFGWLLCDEKFTGVPTSSHLESLKIFLSEYIPFSYIKRIYWYTDQSALSLIDKIIFRFIADVDLNSGYSLLKSISSDLISLASSKAAHSVTLFSDDERLHCIVDQVQLLGLEVNIVCDNSISNFQQLQITDPSWARFLMQADRRLVWNSNFYSTKDIINSENESASIIISFVDKWWKGKTSDEQNQLINELSASHGIPQEIDRMMLLQLSRELGRSLSWSNKKIMREILRCTILGIEFNGYNDLSSAKIAPILNNIC